MTRSERRRRYRLRWRRRRAELSWLGAIWWLDSGSGELEKHLGVLANTSSPWPFYDEKDSRELDGPTRAERLAAEDLAYWAA